MPTAQVTPEPVSKAPWALLTVSVTVAACFKANQTVTDVSVTFRRIGPARTSGSVASFRGVVHTMGTYARRASARDAM